MVIFAADVELIPIDIRDSINQNVNMRPLLSRAVFVIKEKNSHTFIMHNCSSPAIIVVILNSMLPIAGMRLALLQRDCDPLFT